MITASTTAHLFRPHHLRPASPALLHNHLSNMSGCSNGIAIVVSSLLRDKLDVTAELGSPACRPLSLFLVRGSSLVRSTSNNSIISEMKLVSCLQLSSLPSSHMNPPFKTHIW